MTCWRQQDCPARDNWRSSLSSDLLLQLSLAGKSCCLQQDLNQKYRTQHTIGPKGCMLSIRFSLTGIHNLWEPLGLRYFSEHPEVDSLNIKVRCRHASSLLAQFQVNLRGIARSVRVWELITLFLSMLRKISAHSFMQRSHRWGRCLLTASQKIV